MLQATSTFTADRAKRILFIALPVLLAAALLVCAARWLTGDRTPYITGMVEVTHIDVAAKIPARIQRFAVEEGDNVAAGDLLVTFENREVGARVEQARAATAAAEARYQMALHGARKEEIAMAEKAYQQASCNADVLQRTRDRLAPLYAEGVISQQQWDENDSRYKAAVEMRDAAREKYLMVKDGVRPEEKEAARSLFLQARNALAEAESYYDETTLRAPIGGIVEKKIADPGEIVSAGYPLLTVADRTQWWVVVTVEEPLLAKIRQGDTLRCVAPALGGGTILMRVARISVLGEFATHKATNELDSFDTRSFEVKLVPASPAGPLPQGATVLVPAGRHT